MRPGDPGAFRRLLRYYPLPAAPKPTGPVGDVTGQMRTVLERLAFPWLSYNDYSMSAP